jgi:hypothetical protein
VESTFGIDNREAVEEIYTAGHLCNYRGLKASAGSALDQLRRRVDNIEWREEPKREGMLHKTSPIY